MFFCGVQHWASHGGKCYVKLSLLHGRASKTKRTDSAKSSGDMLFSQVFFKKIIKSHLGTCWKSEYFFQQSFNFRVSLEELSDVGVLVQVLESNMLGKGFFF